MKVENLINKFTSLLFICLPISLVSGPFLTDLTVSTLGLYSLINYKKIKLNLIPKNFVIIFIFFYLYLLLLSFTSQHVLLSLESSLFYFRYIFFIFGGILLIKLDNKLIVYFSIVLLVVTTFLIIHSFYLFFLSQTFNDLCMDNSESCRISSLFNDELIMGSYLARMIPLIIISLIILLKNKFNKILIFTMITLLIITCLISGERNSFLLSVISVFLIMLNYRFNKKLFFLFFIPLILILLSFIFTNNIQKRLIDQTVSEMFTNDNFNIISPVYNDLYLNGINIFYQNPIFGTGPKTFRQECLQNIDKFPQGCSTHPHNTYIQLLSETGIIGTSFLILFISYFFLNFIKSIFSKNIRNDFIVIKNLIYISVIVNFFPFASSGNFFNNWISCIYFLPLIFLWGINRETLNNFRTEKYVV